MRYLNSNRPRLFAHRGASGRRPENTLESFAEGLEAGAQLLELDVHASSDGAIWLTLAEHVSAVPYDFVRPILRLEHLSGEDLSGAPATASASFESFNLP